MEVGLGLIHKAAGDDNLAVDRFAQVIQDSTDLQKIRELLGIKIEQEDLKKASMLKPPKMISSVTVIQLVNKGLEDNKKKKAKDAGAKDKKKEEKKKKKKAKDSARKGTLPQHEIENVFYWAE